MVIRTSTEQRLLDAAEDLFFTRGIAATPVDAVLARAGVSAATLYRGYPSKEALVAAALDRRHLAWLACWDEAVERRTDPAERLLAVFEALDVFADRPGGGRWCAFLGSAAEYADAPAEVAEAVQRDTDSLRERLTELAGPVVAHGSPDELAEQLLLLVTGALAMRLRRPGSTADAARRIAAELVAADRR